MNKFVSTGLKDYVFLATFLCLFLLMSSPASGLTITDSSSFNVDLNTGAYITESTADSNLFNQEIFTSGDETKSGTVAFSAIPYFNFSNTLYFQFVYDMQETGGQGQRRISIDDIVVSVSGKGTFWDFDQGTYGSIILNDDVPYTSTPLGAGGDMALYVPVSLFNGSGLTGSDLLTFTVTQSLSDNGTDEWVVLGSGSGGSFFGPGDPINDPPTNPIPEPVGMLLMGAGLMTWGALHRRKRRRRKDQ